MYIDREMIHPAEWKPGLDMIWMDGKHVDVPPGSGQLQSTLGL